MSSTVPNAINAYSIYTDGGARGNPGPAAFAFVIYDPTGKVIHEAKQYFGISTNNQAEYRALVAALTYALQVGLDYASVINCYSDSQLMVRQVNGIYRVKNEELKPLVNEIKTLVTKLPVPIKFFDIRRDQNKYADKLVNQALDEDGYGQIA